MLKIKDILKDGAKLEVKDIRDNPMFREILASVKKEQDEILRFNKIDEKQLLKRITI